MIARHRGRVLRYRQLIRPVASIARASAFYVEALGFEVAHDQSRAGGSSPGDADVEQALAAAAYGSSALATTHLQAGDQWLTLIECPAADLPRAFDTGSGDPHFQHIAVVVADMASAWQRLLARRPEVSLVGQGGPQTLPASSGGVSALKFRDPDGHPVELLSYPVASVPAHWRDAARHIAGRPDDRRVLGIDHTAIGVADAEASIRFYTELLGLTLTARQMNRGIEQERLDGLERAVVDVVALSPEQATPHLELLGYHGVIPAVPLVGVRSFAVLEVDDLAALSARWQASMLGMVAPRATHHERIALAHDPDGHALLLWQA